MTKRLWRNEVGHVYAGERVGDKFVVRRPWFQNGADGTGDIEHDGLEFLRNFKPATEDELLVPGVFFIGEGGLFWPGVHIRSWSWSGFARPFFTESVTIRILESVGGQLDWVNDDLFGCRWPGVSGGAFTSPRRWGLWGLGSGNVRWFYDDLEYHVAEVLTEDASKRMGVSLNSALSQLRNMGTSPFAITDEQIRAKFLSLDFVPSQKHIDMVRYRELEYVLEIRGQSYPF